MACDEQLLGDVGHGYQIARSNLEGGRVGVAAQSVRLAFEAAIAYARERKSFGEPIIERQGIGFRLADIATKIDIARQMVPHAAAFRDARELCLREVSMAKLFASTLAERVCSYAIHTW